MVYLVSFLIFAVLLFGLITFALSSTNHKLDRVFMITISVIGSTVIFINMINLLSV